MQGFSLLRGWFCYNLPIWRLSKAKFVTNFNRDKCIIQSKRLSIALRALGSHVHVANQCKHVSHSAVSKFTLFWELRCRIFVIKICLNTSFSLRFYSSSFLRHVTMSISSWMFIWEFLQAWDVHDRLLKRRERKMSSFSEFKQI
jgi:hypothetical protein